MCNFTGTICALLSFVLLFKYVARKRNMKKLNMMLAKSHKAIGFLFMLFLPLHTALSFPKLAENGIVMILFGYGALFAGIVLTISGCMIKKNPKAMLWHRWSAIAYAVCLIFHVFR